MFTSHFLVCFWDVWVSWIWITYILLKKKTIFDWLRKDSFIYTFYISLTAQIARSLSRHNIQKVLTKDYLYTFSLNTFRGSVCLLLMSERTCWIISFPQTSELLNFLISDFLRWRRLVNYFWHHRQAETVLCIITSGSES